MNQYSISLGKVFGIPISIHWTFWILVLWIIISGLTQGETAVELIWHILFIFCVFICIGLHELGHALTARRYGIQTKQITFLPIGGLASLSKIPTKPVEELIVTIMGPMVNVVIAMLLGLLLSINAKLSNFVANINEAVSINADNFLFFLFFTNIAIVIFNLIPAFPMDGGRIFRSLLAMRVGRIRATRIAVNTGLVFALLFIIIGLFHNPFLVFIALFIFISAQSELTMVQTSESLTNYTSADIMMRKYTVFSEDQTLMVGAEEIINGQDKVFLVKDEFGYVGFFTKDDIIKGLSEIGKNASLKYIMRTDLKWVKKNTNASEIWEMMSMEKSPLILVGENADIDGVINKENLREWLLINNSEKQFEKKEEKYLSQNWAYNS